MKKLFYLTLLTFVLFISFGNNAHAGGCGVSIEEVSPGIAGLHGAYIGVTVCEPSEEDPMVSVNPAGHQIEIHIVNRRGEEYCKMNETVTNNYGKASGQCYSTTTESFQIYAIDTTSGEESIKLSISMNQTTNNNQPSDPMPPTTPSPSAPTTPSPTSNPSPSPTATPTPTPTLTPTATPTTTPVVITDDREEASDSSQASDSTKIVNEETTAPTTDEKTDEKVKQINGGTILTITSFVLGVTIGIGMPTVGYLWQNNEKFRDLLISLQRRIQNKA